MKTIAKPSPKKHVVKDKPIHRAKEKPIEYPKVAEEPYQPQVTTPPVIETPKPIEPVEELPIPSVPEPSPVSIKVADLDWEIRKQPGSGNFRLYKDNGDSSPVTDINTILLWEILKAVSR